MYYYGDNSELTAIWGAEAPDILLVAGYCVPRSRRDELFEAVRHSKKDLLGNEYYPVKWNILSLKQHCQNFRDTNVLQSLLTVSDSLRVRLLAHLLESGATMFASVIQAYSNNRQVLGSTRGDLVGYSFGNILQRLGLFIKNYRQTSRVHVQLILDWPEGSNRAPFIREYWSGWQRGISGEDAGHQSTYYSGPLKDLDFDPAILFGCTEFHPGLQLADLVTGVTRSFIDYAMGSRTKNDFGVQQFMRILPRFYRSNGQILGYGLVVSPVSSNLATMVREAL